MKKTYATVHGRSEISVVPFVSSACLDCSICDWFHATLTMTKTLVVTAIWPLIQHAAEGCLTVLEQYVLSQAFMPFANMLKRGYLLHVWLLYTRY